MSQWSITCHKLPPLGVVLKKKGCSLCLLHHLDAITRSSPIKLIDFMSIVKHTYWQYANTMDLWCTVMKHMFLLQTYSLFVSACYCTHNCHFNYLKKAFKKTSKTLDVQCWIKAVSTYKTEKNSLMTGRKLFSLAIRYEAMFSSEILKAPGPFWS